MRPLALLLFCAAAAFAQKVTMEFDQDADFTHFKTFYINPGQLNSKNAALNNDIIRKKIQDDIRKQLLAKGLMEVTSGARDLNVRFSLGSSRRKEVDVYPARWYGYRRVVSNYTEGTLVLDLRDPSKQALIWRAIAVEEKSDAAHVEGKLDDMVKKSFEQFPPKKK